MSPALAIATYLQTQGVGLFTATDNGWKLTVSTEPSSPANAITIYDTGGLGADTDEQNVFRSLVQVRVRGMDYADAYAKQEEIRNLLIIPSPVQVPGAGFIGIFAQTDILGIGRDDNDRFVFTANYRTVRQI